MTASGFDLPFVHWRERGRRAWCRFWGHRWLMSVLGEPVTRPHYLCLRCGKLADTWRPK